MSFLESLFGKPVPSVSVTEAKALLTAKPAPILVDVREPVEYQQGHIAGSRLIPLGQLGARLSEIPTDKQVLVVCQTGSRSGMAARQLAKAGYTVINVNGGMMSWMSQGLPIKRKGG